MSDNSISAIATGEGVTSSVNCSPTIVLQNDPSQRQGNDHETGFLSDIAQSTADEPSQPLLAHGNPGSCQVSWFRAHPWLEYSVQKDSCYCYPCRLFNREPSDSLFNNPPGDRDWKHAHRSKGSLCLHATSKSHSSVMVMWQQFHLNQQHKTTLAYRMDRLGEQTLRSNRHYIKMIAEIMLLCVPRNCSSWSYWACTFIKSRQFSSNFGSSS